MQVYLRFSEVQDCLKWLEFDKNAMMRVKVKVGCMIRK